MQQRSGVMAMTRYSIAYFIRTKKLDDAMHLIDRGEKINDVMFGSNASNSSNDHRSAEEAMKSARNAALSWKCQFEMDRAMVHDAAGRFTESIAAWDKSMTLHTAFRNIQRAGRALALAGAGDHKAAITEAIVLSAEKQLTQAEYFDLARAYARCCRGNNLPHPEELANSATKYLTKAKEKGYFDMPDTIDVLKNDSDFDALRGRPDFDALLQSLADKRGS
jgi:hypothetical protein